MRPIDVLRVTLARRARCFANEDESKRFSEQVGCVRARASAAVTCAAAVARWLEADASG